MTARRIPRRTFLRAAGVSLALPALDAMVPRGADAQALQPKRFFGFFYPNGKDARFWNPPPGPLDPSALPAMLQDLAGHESERIWPALTRSLVPDVTVVTGVDHQDIALQIHAPSMSLSAHRGAAQTNNVPGAPTLDQVIASHVQGDARFRALTLSSTNSNDLQQGFLSFRAGGEQAPVIRSPRTLFDQLFAGADASPSSQQARHDRVLDRVLEDANRLRARVGAADRLRLEQYFDAVHELDTQLSSGSRCDAPPTPAERGSWHEKSKAFIDLAVLAMACDQTRVVTLQYSNSWGVHYRDYNLGRDLYSLGEWSDHFLSHKVGGRDRATDLDGVPNARAIADQRVVLATRFKVRRFAYLVDRLKSTSTPSGSLYDETLAMYFSENADGDSHSRRDMPYLLAGGVGGFRTGRAYRCPRGTPTGALHASILRYFGRDVGRYGDPAGSALDGL